MSTEAMKLALEALEETRNALAWFYDSYPQDVTKKGNKLLPHVETVLTTLREALAQPQQDHFDPLDYIDPETGEPFNPVDQSSTPQPTQPQQEPVAQWQKRHPHHWEGKWENTNEHDAKWWRDNSQGWEIRPLYTSPPARKPLTDEEMEKIAAEYWLYPRKFVRAIEAAHGIKENT